MFLLINTERRKDIMQDLETENLNVIDDGRYDPLDHNTRHECWDKWNYWFSMGHISNVETSNTLELYKSI